MVLKLQILLKKANMKMMDQKISDVDNVSGLVKKTDFNAKITEVEGKIPSISGLATNSVLTAVENKIPDVSSLVKKTDYDAGLKKLVTELLQINRNICLL